MAVNLPNYPSNFKFLSAAGGSAQVGKMIGALLPYVYVVAGLLMLLMLIMGGVTLMTAAGDQNKTKEGYGKIQAGIIGFIIIFVSYFVVQITEVVLGVKIL